MPFSIPVLATAQNMAGVLPPQPSSIDTSKALVNDTIRSLQSGYIMSTCTSAQGIELVIRKIAKTSNKLTKTNSTITNNIIFQTYLILLLYCLHLFAFLSSSGILNPLPNWLIFDATISAHSSVGCVLLDGVFGLLSTLPSI